MQDIYGYAFWFLLALIVMIFDMLISDPKNARTRPPGRIHGKRVKK